MVRTDSVSRTVAVFVIFYKNNSFSETILKNGLSRWLLKWGGKIFWENALTKPHFCRDRWGGNISRCFVEFHKNKFFPETCKKSACFVGYLSERNLCKLYEIEKVLENTQKLASFDAYQVRGILGSFHEKEIIFRISYIFAILDAYQVRGIWVACMKNIWKHVNFWPTSMPTTWEVSLARKYFLQNTLTKPRFCRDRWRGAAPLNVPWQVHNHSSDTFSPTRAGRPCAMTVMCERLTRASTAG